MLLTDEEIVGLIANREMDGRFLTTGERWDIIKKAQLKKDLVAYGELRGALENLLKHYLGLVNSGDAGLWNPEEEEIVIATRQALLKEVKDEYISLRKE